MNKYKTINGIIFRTYDSGVADLVVNIITNSGALHKSLAKGARKATSKKGFNIELGNQVQVKIVDGYAVPIMSEISVKNSFAKSKKELKQKLILMFLCELIGKVVVEGHSEPKLYKTSLEALDLLSTFDALKIGSILPLHFLFILGYLPDLSIDTKTQNKLKDKKFFLSNFDIGYSNEFDNSNYTDEGEIRIYKSQKFILNYPLKSSLSLKLSDTEWNKMLKLHIAWFERALDTELKSKYTLFSIIK